MTSFEGWMLGVVGNLVAAATGALAVWLYARSRHARLEFALSRLARGRTVQIVVPQFSVGNFRPDGSLSTIRIPPNVRVIPMAEGGAIAELVDVLKGSLNKTVRLSLQSDYQDSYALTICIGGPPVNQVSAELLMATFPEFQIITPKVHARYASISYSSRRHSDGALSEDYGFIASVKSTNGNRHLILCGVWAIGTQIATHALTAFITRNSDVGKAIRKQEDFLMVVRAPVNGLVHGHIDVVALHRR